MNYLRIDRKCLAIGFTILIAASILYGCGKSKDGSSGIDDNKDFKIGMLTNYADNIIIPAYTGLKSNLDLLDISVNEFLSDPSIARQQSLKPIFKNTYISFEDVSAVYFGPASALLLNNAVNSFPAAGQKIETAVQSGNYDFSAPMAADSIQGLPALDYMLFCSDAVQKFSDADAAKRKKYVQDIMARMKSLVANALSQWQGSYYATFINSTKTDVGSSIGYLVNQFAFEMDAMKGPRMGWPYGKQSGGIVFADKCEGYYSGISVSLAVANITSLKNYYTGGSRDGIADYLILLKKEQLNNEVLAQFDLVLAKLQAIPDPMSEAFTSNKPLIDAAYKEVQTLLTLIKTDVASATGVRISYQDSDGD